jgi:hypothetical protein
MPIVAHACVDRFDIENPRLAKIDLIARLTSSLALARHFRTDPTINAKRRGSWGDDLTVISLSTEISYRIEVLIEQTQQRFQRWTRCPRFKSVSRMLAAYSL